MKILHTSDWHLGQKLFYLDREEEQSAAFDWLVDVIVQQGIDVLIVAGDIFDTSSPSNSARKLYYNFLSRVNNSSCKHIIIIAGNHDSPMMLSAPGELLKSFNIHLVGNRSENIADDVIKLFNAEGKCELIVAAVPFLRERDLRNAELADTSTARLDAIRSGIKNHYHNIAEEIKKDPLYLNIPVVATGHLFVSGADSYELQQNIYVGDSHNIQANQFPAEFDYVALGHIHKSQPIGKNRNIRYCGSLIPLNMEEKNDTKSVTILTFKGKSLKDISLEKAPTYRNLLHLTCAWSELPAKLNEISLTQKNSTWIELELTDDQKISNLDNEIKQFSQNYSVEIVKIRMRNVPEMMPFYEELDLEELNDEVIFKKRLDQALIDEKTQAELIEMYSALKTELQELD